MRNYLLYLSVAAATAFSGMAQVMVNTELQTRDVLMEKFTGINCGACPGGDVIISDLSGEHGNKFHAIAYHSFGGESGDQPVYGTPYGNALASISQGTGYPCGNVNRIIFSDLTQNGGTAMGSSNWTQAVDSVLSYYAPTNIATKFRYDIDNEKLYVDLEAYFTQGYTGNQRIMVALVQNKIIGPQAGEGDNYEHNHMFRELLLQETIGVASVGTLYTNSFEAVLADRYGPVDVNIDDMEIVAFVLDDEDQVLNSTSSKVEKFVNYDINPKLDFENMATCESELSASVLLTNHGNDNLTSAQIEYTINGVEYNHTWTGDLQTFETAQVQLPTVTFLEATDNLLEVNIVNSNNQGPDAVLTNNNFVREFSGNKEIHAQSTVEIKLDGFGSEVTATVLDEDGSVHFVAGPFADGNDDVLVYSFALNVEKCYQFIMTDAEGNGLAGGEKDGVVYPAGYFKLMSGGEIVASDVNFGKNLSQSFTIDLQTVGIEENDLNSLTVLPNPNNGQFQVSINAPTSGEYNYQIIDNLGRSVWNGNTDLSLGNNTLDIDAEVAQGIYTLIISNGTSRMNSKIVVQ